MHVSEKTAGALRTIGEVAVELGIEPHVLRFWEEKFKQIKPQKRRGRRYYRPEDVKLVSIVKALLYTQGFTIKGAQRFLKNHADDIDASHVLKLTESMLVQKASTKEENPLEEDSHDVLLKKEDSTQAYVKKPTGEELPFEELMAVTSIPINKENKENKESLSDNDKRRLKEIYKGLHYTKEKLDRLLTIEHVDNNV
jgi:DNA-binding transcriptional MerR regulator